jgi:hypothetical protein
MQIADQFSRATWVNHCVVGDALVKARSRAASFESARRAYSFLHFAWLTTPSPLFLPINPCPVATCS